MTGEQTAAFRNAWIRFSRLQKEILPEAKLVFCPNDGTSEELNLKWTDAFPGAEHVDVLAVDTYNQYPFLTTAAQFKEKSLLVDKYGAPVGIEQHRLFAEEKGLPFAIAEWSTNSALGDGAVFIEQLHRWITKHAGDGAGQLLYEILFNVSSYNSGIFSLYPQTSALEAARTYVEHF